MEAVQAFAPEEVTRLSRLKKMELAAEAEHLAAGTGWLPGIFQSRPEETVEVRAVCETKDSAGVASRTET